MRLAQLARKHDIPKKDILNFLASKGISIESHGNTKVEDEHVSLVEKHFGNKQPKNKVASPPVTKDKKSTVDTGNLLKEEKKNKEIKADQSEVKEEKVEEKPIEVIRPKKVKLQGIKVIGKIDLPEPPKKEIKEDESVKDAEDKPATSKGPAKKGFRKTYKKEDRKPRRQLSFEEKQKKEERERLRIERQQKKALKEKKKRRYEEKVLAKHKPARKPKKKSRAESVSQKKKPVLKHKNIFRRFWAWLNGEYDQF